MTRSIPTPAILTAGLQPLPERPAPPSGALGGVGAAIALRTLLLGPFPAGPLAKPDAAPHP